MKKMSMAMFEGNRIFANLLVITAVILFAGGAQAAIDCTQCHGINGTTALPGDTPAGLPAAYRNITTGDVKGNHNTHSGAVTTGQTCARCHGSASAPTSAYQQNHAVLSNYSIRMISGVNYSKGNSFRQTATPTLGTCSNADCHFRVPTPTWGQTTYASQKNTPDSDSSNTCAQCHLGATLATGKHQKHIANYNNDLSSCTKCHPNNYTPTGAAAFSHVTSSATKIRISFAAAPNNGSGTPGALRNAPDYLPGGPVSGATCTATYCHKGASATPAWNGAATTCVSCHDATSTGLSTVHNRHYNSATPPTVIDTTNANTLTGYVYGCANCHPSVTHVQGAAGSTGPVFQDAQISGAKITTYTPGAATSTTDAKGYNYTTNATCTTVCHTRTGLIADTPVVAANWSGASTGSCAVCHKASGEPIGTMISNGANGLTVNHNLHVAADRYGLNTNFSCASCHSGTATNNTTINGAAGRNQHPDAIRNVAMNVFATGGAVAIGGSQGNQTCSNTYCHGDGRSTAPISASIDWTGGAMGANCTGCHKGNSAASAANRIASNVHAQHLYSSARVGRTVGCKDCHIATVSNDATISSYTNHVDRNVNIKYDNAAGINRDSDAPTYVSGTPTTSATGATKTPGAAGYTCNNLYCHSVGNLGTSNNIVNAGGFKFRNVDWNGGALGCDGCHGNQTGKSYPVYTSGLAGYSSANSHIKHVESSSFGCDYCHYNTVTQTGIYPTQVRMNNYSGHLNRSVNIRFKPNAGLTGFYTPGNAGVATKTCSNTYCHGSAASDAWGGTTTCASCHDASKTGLSALHAQHFNSTTTATVLAGGTNRHTASGYVYACLNCHPTLTHATGQEDPTGPIFQDANIDTTGLKLSGYAQGLSSTPDSKNYNYTQGTCTTVCHTRNGALTAPPVVAITSWGTAPTGSCAVCHKAAGQNYAAMVLNGYTGLSAKHNQHVASDRYGQNTNFTCNSCHNGTALNNTTINGASGRAQHPNTTKDVAFNGTVGGTWSSPTCSNTYCHSIGTSATGFHGPLNWTSGTVAADCSGCHGSTAASRITTNVHAQHLFSSARVGRTVGCKDCHNATIINSDDRTIASYTNHVNKNVNIKYDNAAGINRNSDKPAYGTYTTTGVNGYAKAAGAGGYTCSNLYCHSVGNLGTSGNLVNAGGVKFQSPAWNGGALGCDGCHGGGGKSHPGYTSGLAGYSSSNSHLKHVETRLLGCDNCHFNTVTQSTIPPTQVRMNNYSGHLNRVANVRIKPKAGLTGSYNITQGQKNCSNTYCHSSGRAQFSTPQWGGSTTCLSCHGGRTIANGNYTFSTGGGAFRLSTTHSQHLKYPAANINCQMCHSKTVTDAATLLNYSSYIKHGNGVKDVTFTNPVYGTYTAYKSSRDNNKCGNISCHGGKSRNGWSTTVTNNDNTCVHCHGVPGTATGDTNRNLYAPGWGGTGTSTDGNSVASDVRVGAHFGHLSSVYMKKLKCNECHTVPDNNNPFNGTHMAVQRFTSPTISFAQASTATRNNIFTSFTSGTAIKAATCSTVYCHGAKMINGSTNGTNTKPSWDSTAYLTGSPGVNDCNKCHGAPPNTGGHGAVAANDLDACTTCHSNLNAGGTFKNKALHINGTVEAAGGCNGCHDYDTTGGGTAWGKTNYGGFNEGGGAHAKHIEYIKTRWNTPPLAPATDTFGGTNMKAVCGVCHTVDPAQHTTGTPGNPRWITFGEFPAIRQFGPGAPWYNGFSNTASSTNAKSCKNIDCHFKTSPVWP